MVLFGAFAGSQLAGKQTVARVPSAPTRRDVTHPLPMPLEEI